MHVLHPRDAVDRGLDGLGDALFNDLGVGACVGGTHPDRRRRDRRILRHRDPLRCEPADDADQQRQDDGEPRPVYEDVRGHLLAIRTK